MDAGISPAISIHHLGNVGATKSERAGISKLKSDMKMVGCHDREVIVTLLHIGISSQSASSDTHTGSTLTFDCHQTSKLSIPLNRDGDGGRRGSYFEIVELFWQMTFVFLQLEQRLSLTDPSKVMLMI